MTYVAGPDSLFGLIVARNSEVGAYCARIPAWSDVGHKGFTHTMLQTVQRPGVCSVVYGVVHYNKPLTSFDKSRA